MTFHTNHFHFEIVILTMIIRVSCSNRMELSGRERRVGVMKKCAEKYLKPEMKVTEKQDTLELDYSCKKQFYL